MATTLPSLTRTIDDAFVHTWYEIRPEAIDNILDANPVTAALRMKGSFKPEVGGEYITRTIKYGTKTATAFAKGSTLSSGEDDIETMARWTWRYIAAHIQRSLVDDQKNSGPNQIKSLVGTKIQAAKDALETKIETSILSTSSGAISIQTDESGNEPQGIYDAISISSNAPLATGTYGGINRPTTYASNLPTVGNTWWSPKFASLTANPEVNLLGDMESLYNSITDNNKAPNLIIADQTLFEVYGLYATDAAQIAKRVGGIADLGFSSYLYKGKDMIWSSNMTTTGPADSMIFLNTDYFDVVYDPNYWFEMTEFKPIALQTERIAHIIAVFTCVSSQLRRHGILYSGS